MRCPTDMSTTGSQPTNMGPLIAAVSAVHHLWVTGVCVSYLSPYPVMGICLAFSLMSNFPANPIQSYPALTFQEYEETCLFTKHESLQGDSPRVYPNILKYSLHSLVTKGIRLVGFATRAMVCESPTHYLILNSLAFARGRVILRSHFLILLLLIILISHYILTYFSLLQ